MALGHIKNIFTAVSIIGVILLISYFLLQDDLAEKFYKIEASFFAKIMMYYLILVFIRLAVHLILSFMDYMFTRRLSESETYPLVTIIVPAYNEETGIVDSIESLIRIDYPNKEIIVIDDGSTDGTFEAAMSVARVQQEVRVISKPNGGKAMALNRGISEANGDYYMCMDADSILSQNVLRMAMKYFQNYPKLAAVAGGVYVANKHNLLTKFQDLEYVIGLNFYKTAQSFLNIVPIVPGPIGVFKKQAVIDVGGYCANTFAEDSDLSMKLLMAGHDIKYCAAMKAMTEAPASVNQLMTQRYRWNRGMVQAITDNLKKTLFEKGRFDLRSFFVLIYMFLETVIIPIINFMFVMITLQHAFLYGVENLMGPFFLALTLLDMVLSLYSIVMDKSIGWLFILAIFNRVTYGFALEIVRFFSLIDELFKIPMKWGEMERKGIK